MPSSKLYNSKIAGNRIGSGCWSSFCGRSKNTSCGNLSGKIISSGVLSGFLLKTIRKI